ncbi:zinc finger MYM-type protein 1 [Trichonephila clavata]|uniref:Zinc finger MYM-type protein 1 n=1 Tax=Trichonephila clavata TaxID=2740835 RepID=A0A8X6K702_TRICU|nr:zinc finger MYM-type protein 1 [Trichonephila clavata]
MCGRSCVGAVSFFKFLQEMCNFFSVSAHRWANMLQYIEDSKDSELDITNVNDTRWCARADAAMALSVGYSSFQKVLQVIAEDVNQKLQENS